jgi:hypothetical protein
MAASTVHVNAAVVRSAGTQQLRAPAQRSAIMLLAPKRRPSRQPAVQAMAGGNGALVTQKEAASLDVVEKKYLTERANHVTKHFETALGEFAGLHGLAV